METVKKVKSILFYVLLPLVLVISVLWITSRRFRRCLVALHHYLIRANDGCQETNLPPVQSGNSVRLLVNGNETLPVMLEMINSARHSILWQVMLFHPDHAGQELANAIAKAARRGVRVQLSFNLDQTVNGTIADRYSTSEKGRNRERMQALLAELHSAGVEVRANRPGTKFLLKNVDLPASAVQRDIHQHSCLKFNHYDHRKLLIIDNHQALLGGMNVGQNYLYHSAPDLSLDMVVEARQRLQENLPEAWPKWLDAAVILDGPVVSQMVEEFNWKWQVLGGYALPGQRGILPVQGGAPVQFLRQQPGTRQVGAAFFDMVSAAQDEIYVASPFVSYPAAIDALRAAGRRGVHVIFVVPNQRNTMKISARIFRQFANSLLEAGVELYFNNLRMAHTKLLVADAQQVLIGSMNLNYRSFCHDQEVAARVLDEGFARQVIEQVFQPYLRISSRVQHPLDPGWHPFDWIIRPFT